MNWIKSDEEWNNVAPHVSSMLNVSFVFLFFSLSALNKHKIHELKCPWGLQEKDFMDLLRSTFSLLAGQAFKVLTLQSGKLLPLKVNRLVPEEIQRAIGSVDQGFPPPVLYIQLPVCPFAFTTNPDSSSLKHRLEIKTCYRLWNLWSNLHRKKILNL